MRLTLLCTLIGLTVHGSVHRAVAAALPRPPRHLLGPVKSSSGTHNSKRNLISKCERKWFDSFVDHFSAVSCTDPDMQRHLQSLYSL